MSNNSDCNQGGKGYSQIGGGVDDVKEMINSYLNGSNVDAPITNDIKTKYENLEKEKEKQKQIIEHIGTFEDEEKREKLLSLLKSPPAADPVADSAAAAAKEPAAPLATAAPAKKTETPEATEAAAPAAPAVAKEDWHEMAKSLGIIYGSFLRLMYDAAGGKEQQDAIGEFVYSSAYKAVSSAASGGVNGMVHAIGQIPPFGIILSLMNFIETAVTSGTSSIGSALIALEPIMKIFGASLGKEGEHLQKIVDSISQLKPIMNATNTFSTDLDLGSYVKTCSSNTAEEEGEKKVEGEEKEKKKGKKENQDQNQDQDQDQDQDQSQDQDQDQDQLLDPMELLCR